MAHKQSALLLWIRIQFFFFFSCRFPFFCSLSWFSLVADEARLVRRGEEPWQTALGAPPAFCRLGLNAHYFQVFLQMSLTSWFWQLSEIMQDQYSIVKLWRFPGVYMLHFLLEVISQSDAAGIAMLFPGEPAALLIICAVWCQVTLRLWKCNERRKSSLQSAS